MHRNSQGLSKFSITHTVISSVDAGFRFAPVTFPNLATVIEVIWMGFLEFFIRDAFDVEYIAGVNTVHVEAQTQGLFHVGVISLPDDNLEVGPVQVHVEEFFSLIGDKE